MAFKISLLIRLSILGVLITKGSYYKVKAFRSKTLLWQNPL